MRDKDDSWENPYWVGWADNGKRIEVDVDGVVKAGCLHIADTDYTDGEEIPVFRVRFDDGTDAPFVAFGRWRFA